MDFAEELAALAAQIPKRQAALLTEAATATTLVLPFIRALGYDVFDPDEVVPEFTCDVGTKKGEKVDFAVMRAGVPTLLIEVKHHTAALDVEHSSQLFRYFTTSKARFGVITNGIVYRFFTDLEQPNIMDERPFLEFSMVELSEPVVDALRRFTKTRFDVDAAVFEAAEWKYTVGIKRLIASEAAEPNEEIVRYFAKQVYGGNITPKVRDQFRDVVRRAFGHFVNDAVQGRLQAAMQPAASTGPASLPGLPSTPPVEAAPALAADGGSPTVVTTAEEVEGYHIVKAIVAELVDPGRVVMRDAQSYCAILLDDNNRKPVARLRFGPKSRALGLFDADRNEEKIALQSLSEIYRHAERLRATVRAYIEGGR